MIRRLFTDDQGGLLDRPLPSALTRTLAATDAIRLAALLPIVVLSDIVRGPDLLAAAVTMLAFQALFAFVRRRRMETGGLATAIAFVLLLPADIPLLHLVLGAAGGIVLAELIFGGRGWGFLNPAVVGLALVHFSLAGAAQPIAPPDLRAVAAGALLLLALGLADWRVILSGLLAIALMLPLAAFSGTVLFALAFLAADPANLPLTKGGRWIYGAGIVALAALLQPGTAEPSANALIFALMLAGIFAPLADAAVLALRNRFRGRP